MKEETMRLNPFVYISETDIRFYLLVLIGIIMPSLWASLFGVIIFSSMGGTEIISLFQRLLIVVLIFSFIPILIYWIYKRYPRKIIKKSKLKEFDKKRFQDHHGCIKKLYGKYLSTVKRPTLMYRFTKNPLELPFTFGTKDYMYISIPSGLIMMFRKNIGGFKSIFLHEMGHIANRDVEKTYLADSTWKSLFLTLSIPFGILLIFGIILTSSMLYYGILAGYSLDYIISRINPGRASLLYGGVILYFLIFWGIVYVLRKQIIQVREFYADAKVLEWEESPEEIVKTLEEFRGEFKPKIEPNLVGKCISMAKRIIPKLTEEAREKFGILTKFHPNINERIQVLKNNSTLFAPSLWVAFTIGFFYGLIESYSMLFKLFIFSDTIWIASGEYSLSVQDIAIGFRALISIFIFTILMLAVSSSFHKSILKDAFSDNTGYFSPATILNAIKFSLVFSLGWLTSIMPIITDNSLYLYEINILIGNLLDIARIWISHAVYFSMALIFLLIFASMLIRRSFSKKEAGRNFLMITVLSSFLYIINRFVAIEILHNKPLLIVFFLIFSVVTYTFIKIKEKKLLCPGCSKKIDFSVFRLKCQNCQQDLYPWAIYSFSKTPPVRLI